MAPWSRRTLVASAVLAALVLAVYAQVRDHAFVNVDDQQYVYRNPQVLRGLTWGGVAWAFTTFRAANWHPLTWLSHMADVELFGLAAGRHHLVSVALHLLNTLLLFRLLRGTTGAAGRSATAAAIFGIHPLHVESVAWVSERKDVLSTLLLLLVLLAWARFAAEGRRRWYLAALGLLALGLAAKPMLVTAPALLLLLDWWPLGRLGATGGSPALRLARLGLEKVPFLGLAAASAAVTWVAQSRGEAAAALAGAPFSERLSNALVSCVRYLASTFWPANLTVFYPHPGLAGGGTPGWQAALALALLCGVTALAARLRRGEPYLLWGWLWFLTALGPVIGLVQVGAQARADRYTYVPHIGLLVAIVWGASAALERLRLPRALAWASGSAAVLALAVAGFRQVATWRDSVTLHRHALEATERNWNAWVGLGDAYRDLGRPEEAIACSLEALRLYPTLAQAWNDMGVAKGQLGRHAEALRDFQQALRVYPAYGAAWRNLGTAHAALGHMELAASSLQEAVRLRPDDARALEDLGVTYLLLGDRARALETLRRVRELDQGGGARLERLLGGGR